ncbi:MAG: hypothetical protein ACLQKA_15705 [Bryobacteraceae bacterium]
MRWMIGVVLSAGVVFGQTGVYTFTGTASGTVGGTPFTNATLTVTSTGNVSAVSCTGGTCELNVAAGASSFTISGIGSGTFSGASYVFDNQNFGLAGFGVGTDDIQIYDSSIGSAAFATYNLLSSIGPLGPEAADPSTSDWVNLSTSLGSFTVTSFTNVTFQATIGGSTLGTPVPASLLLVGLGLACLLVWKFRAQFSV